MLLCWTISTASRLFWLRTPRTTSVSSFPAQQANNLSTLGRARLWSVESSKNTTLLRNAKLYEINHNTELTFKNLRQLSLNHSLHSEPLGLSFIPLKGKSSVRVTFSFDFTPVGEPDFPDGSSLVKEGVLYAPLWLDKCGSTDLFYQLWKGRWSIHHENHPRPEGRIIFASTKPQIYFDLRQATDAAVKTDARLLSLDRSMEKGHCQRPVESSCIKLPKGTFIEPEVKTYPAGEVLILAQVVKARPTAASCR